MEELNNDSDHDDRDKTTDQRDVWEDVDTPYHDGLKPYFPLQKNTIDMMRIIIMQGKSCQWPNEPSHDVPKKSISLE